MTVEKPEFDPELEGAASVVINSICHASKTEYDDGDQRQTTECGKQQPEMPLTDPEVQIGARKNFVDADGLEMCPDCWPDSVM